MRIQSKIIILISSTLTLAILVAAHFSYKFSEKEDHEQVLQEEAEKITRQVQALVPYDGKVELTVLEDGFRDLMVLVPHLERVDAFLFTPDGGLEHFYSKARYDAKRAGHIERDVAFVKEGQISLRYEEEDGVNYVNFVAPLKNATTIYGLVEIKISHEDYYNLIASRRIATIVITVASVLVIAGVLIFSMDYMVNRPIQRLLGVIEEVKQGNLSVNVAADTNDEVGVLTDHFNGMVQSLRRSNEEKEALLARINSYNDELQSKVNAATEELLRRNEALRVANQSIYNIQKKLGHSRRLAAVGQLAATVAHELGTPLHSISGHIQLLLEERDLGADKIRRLKIMQSQLERIIVSIKDILDTTRQPEAKWDMFDLNGMLEDIVILMMPETLSRQIVIEKDLQHDLPKVYGNSGRIQEVFLNLIDNAIDASPEGSRIVLSTSVSGPTEDESFFREGEWIKVSVTDRGRGIPEDQMAEIFVPFYTTKAHGHGSGLGLSISREIVQNHHGHITVRSRPEEGSTFTVFLPSCPQGQV